MKVELSVEKLVETLVDARVERMAGKRVVLSDPRMVVESADLLVVARVVQLAVSWADW